MDNITIGIVARKEVINNTCVNVITNNNLKYLHNLCNCIGLINFDNEFNYETLRLCDGIIIQGGIDIFDYHYKIVEYAINNNIPLLGICMGHQVIGLYSNGCDDSWLVEVDNHSDSTKKHLINFDKNSQLHNIFGSSYYVNSRHSYKVKKVKEPFKATAYSEDDVIEAIEYVDDNHFIIGVQWHPEDMEKMQGLYNYFLKEVIKRKNKN